MLGGCVINHRRGRARKDPWVGGGDMHGGGGGERGPRPITSLQFPPQCMPRRAQKGAYSLRGNILEHGGGALFISFKINGSASGCRKAGEPPTPFCAVITSSLVCLPGSLKGIWSV